MKTKQKSNDNGRRLNGTKQFIYAIGVFYQNLFQTLLSRDRSLIGMNHTDSEGDFKSLRLRTLFEVKGGSNSGKLTIFPGQLERHLKGVGTDFLGVSSQQEQLEYCVYFLFSYSSKDWVGSQMVTVLQKRVHNEQELKHFLSKRTSELIMVDARILDMIWQKFGETNYGATRDSNGNARYVSSVVNVSREYLRKLSLNAHELLAGIGLADYRDQYIEPGQSSIQPVDFRRRYQGDRLNFKIYPLVPLAIRQELLSLMKGEQAVSKDVVSAPGISNPIPDFAIQPKVPVPASMAVAGD